MPWSVDADWRLHLRFLLGRGRRRRRSVDRTAAAAAAQEAAAVHLELVQPLTERLGLCPLPLQLLLQTTVDHLFGRSLIARLVRPDQGSLDGSPPNLQSRQHSSVARLQRESPLEEPGPDLV